MKTQKRCPYPFCGKPLKATIVKGLYVCEGHSTQSYEPCKPYPASRDEKRRKA